MYKKGAGNDKQGKDAGSRTLCLYRNFSQAINEDYSLTRRASPLAGAGFHPHFTWEFNWRASSGKSARHLDVSYKFLLSWIKISNEQCISVKMSGPPARPGPLCCVYMENFQLFNHINAKSFHKRDYQSSRISPKRASPSGSAGSPPYKHPLSGQIP